MRTCVHSVDAVRSERSASLTLPASLTLSQEYYSQDDDCALLAAMLRCCSVRYSESGRVNNALNRVVSMWLPTTHHTLDPRVRNREVRTGHRHALGNMSGKLMRVLESIETPPSGSTAAKSPRLQPAESFGLLRALYVYMYIHIYIYIYMYKERERCMYICKLYIYIYIERERDVFSLLGAVLLPPVREVRLGAKVNA